MNPRGLTILLTAWVLVAAGACGKSGTKKVGGSGGSSEGQSSSSSSAEGGSSGSGGGATASPMDAGLASGDAGPSSPDGGGQGDAPASADGGPFRGDAGGRGGAGGSTSGTSATGGSTSKPDAGPGACRVEISPASVPSLSGLVPGESVSLAVKGTIVWGATTPVTPDWQWTVKGPDGTSLPTTVVPSSERNSASIQFPLLAPGVYDIIVAVTPTCRTKVTATAVKEPTQLFFVRVLPPSTAGPNSGQTCVGGSARWCPSQDAVPHEENNLILQTGQPQNVSISLLKGYSVKMDPVQPAPPTAGDSPRVVIPSYIRVAPHGSTWSFDGASSNEEAMLALLHPLLRYDVLVVPNASPEDTQNVVFPPFRIASRLAQEFRDEDFSASLGVSVQGSVRVGGGPLMGARVLLRADATDPVTLPLPSTWGNTDMLGEYSLRARGEALFSVIVVPPIGTTLPQVTVPNCIDLRGAADGSVVGGVDFAWNALPSTSLTVTVMMPDGQSPATSVQVRLQSRDGTMPEPGTLLINGQPAESPSGDIRLEGTTDKSGVVTFPAIPRAGYHLVLMPSDDATDAAITVADIDLTTANTEDQRIFQLARKVKLTGRILPTLESAGGRLLATDTGSDILVSMISASVDSGGNYTLMASPGRTYRFSFEPAPGQNLPTRIPLYGVTTTSQNAQLADRRLPAGLKVSGTVRFSNKGVPGAIIQAYCQQTGMSGCIDPQNPAPTLPPPLVEITTQADGSFSFYLLDPGTG